MARVTGRRAAVLAAAVALDLIAGEPPAAVHPVVWIGRAMSALERGAPARGTARQVGYGALMTALVVGGAGIAAGMLVRTVGAHGRAPQRQVSGVLVEAAALKSLFAVRALLAAGEGVRRPLAVEDVGAARAALASLVSRETVDLSPGLIAAAAIESLAENLTDSALAPWLAYAGLGLPGAAAYRALNTLDSMIGYRGRYEYLGKVAARLDDAANLIPARLGALLTALAAPAGDGSMREAWRTVRRDHGCTPSPNAGWTMAAMAGALGVRLEKRDVYTLGDGPEPGSAEIRRAQMIVGAALAIGLGVAAGVAWTCDRVIARDGFRRARVGMTAEAVTTRGTGDAGARRAADG